MLVQFPEHISFISDFENLTEIILVGQTLEEQESASTFKRVRDIEGLEKFAKGGIEQWGWKSYGLVRRRHLGTDSRKISICGGLWEAP